MIHRLVILVTLLCLGAPAGASAALTAAENADVKSLISSSLQLRTAERYLMASIACCSTPEARATLATALERFRAAQIEHWRALAFFLHAGTENPTPLPAFTDAEWHTKAWFHTARYKLRLTELAVDLTTAQAHHVDNAAYQDNLRRARDIHVASALAHVTKMDSALPYDDPWPALRPGKTVPTSVGPHGDHRKMIWLMNRGKNYGLDTYGHLIAAYRGGADGVKMRNAWTQSSAVFDILDRAHGLLVNVTFTAEEASEDRFCRVLRVVKLLTVNAAEKYQAWGGEIAAFLPPPFDLVVDKHVDSWKHGVDLSTWESMVFPESTRCKSPFLAK